MHKYLLILIFAVVFIESRSTSNAISIAPICGADRDVIQFEPGESFLDAQNYASRTQSKILKYYLSPSSACDLNSISIMAIYPENTANPQAEIILSLERIRSIVEYIELIGYKNTQLKIDVFPTNAENKKKYRISRNLVSHNVIYIRPNVTEKCTDDNCETP
ncbi:MAG: hypothetical protein V3U82_07980 [Robiginitomaculum sp.]